MRTIIAAALAVSLTACGPTPDPVVDNRNAATPSPVPVATPSAAPQGSLVAIDADGLRLVDPASGRARPVPFATPRGEMLSLLAFRGAPDTGTNAECGAGPLAWAKYRDGLTLQFQDERFVGWSIDRAGAGQVSTMAGIAPGSTRKQLDSAYAITLPDSTLGVEFAAGDMGGLLDGPGPAAKITTLWAGTTCMFR